MNKLEIQGPFDKGRRGKAYIPGKSLTEQSHSKGVDINTIVSRFKKTGDTQILQRTVGDYQELERIDLHEAMNQITKANEIFMELPSKIRNRFDNDPEKYFDYSVKAENHDEMRELGLLAPIQQEVIQKVEIVGGEATQGDEGAETQSQTE